MEESIAGTVTGLLIGLILGGLIVGAACTSYWHRQTVWHQAAHYDSLTGNWQWNNTNIVIPIP